MVGSVPAPLPPLLLPLLLAQRVWRHQEMRDAVLLVLANKQDLVTALSPDEVADGLNLYAIRDRPWQIQACSAKSGEGLQDGMEWLVKQVRPSRR